MNYYPLFLNVKHRKAVIIGGGAVAERKAAVLIRSGACVTVISPRLTRRLSSLSEKKRITHISRIYRKGDTRDAFIVIAATDCPEVNRQIAMDARCPVNVVDVPDLCSFIVPSVINRGALTIAISTGGASPAVSKAIRKELEAMYGPEVRNYLSFLSMIRKEAIRRISDRRSREKFLKGLASPEVMKELRSKGIEQLKEKVLNRLAALAD